MLSARGGEDVTRPAREGDLEWFVPKTPFALRWYLSLRGEDRWGDVRHRHHWLTGAHALRAGTRRVLLALSIVSLGAVVGSLGLPKTVVGLVAENVGVGRPGCARRVIRTVLGLGVFGALGIYGQLADAELPSQLEDYKCYSVRAVLSPPFPFNRAAPSSCFLASVPGPSGSGLCRTSL